MILAIALGVVVLSFVWVLDLLFFRKWRSRLRVLPGPEPDSKLFGNMAKAFGSDGAQYLEDLADTYGGALKWYGVAGMSWRIFVADPEAMFRMLITEPENWRRPVQSTYFNRLVFGEGLVTVEGADHKRQRKFLTPIFSQGQIRTFIPAFFDIGHRLCAKIKADIVKGGTNEVTLDLMNLASRTALDIVGKAAIGYDFNTIAKDSEYNVAVKRLFPTLFQLGPPLALLHILAKFGPYAFRQWILDVVTPYLGWYGEATNRLRSIIRIMDKKSWEIFTEKKAEVEVAGVQEHEGGGKDVISSLLHAASSPSGLNEQEILAQIQTMVFAGHETTSGAICSLLTVVAADHTLQDRLRKEITEAKIAHGGGEKNLDYEAVNALPFLDAMVRETLRMFPPLPTTQRSSLIDTVLPLSTPVKAGDGKTELTEFFVPKGTTITVGIRAMNRSPLLWGEDAKEFKPDRWLERDPVKASAGVKNPSVYSSIMTFSGGPRSCIGFKFAVMEIKVVIFMLIQAFKFSPGGKEITWRGVPTLHPLVVGEEDKGPQLPLKVSIII